MESMELYGVLVVPLIMGFLEVLKRLGLNCKYIPICSIILGLAIGIIFLSNGDIKQGVILGLGIGLSSVGLYSGTKNTLGK